MRERRIERETESKTTHTCARSTKSGSKAKSFMIIIVARSWCVCERSGIENASELR